MARALATLFAFLCTLQPVWASSSFQVGVQHNYVNLRFDSPDHLEGWLTGINLGAQYQWCWAYSAIDFEGYWNIVPLSGAPCQRSRLEEYLLDWKIGASIRCCQLVLKPYVGFGWNYLRNKQDPDGGGLTYQYNKLVVPVGLTACYPLFKCASIGLNGEWRPDVYARLKFIGRKWTISKENAFRIAVPLNICFDWCWCGCPSLSIAPFYDWNRFGNIRRETSTHVHFPIPQLTRWDLGLFVVFGLTF